MAVGDVVNGLGAATSALTFTPAGSNQILITQLMGYDNWCYLTDGVTPAYIGFMQGSTGNNDPQDKICKIFINNTNYLNMAAPTQLSNGYTGIQIK